MDERMQFDATEGNYHIDGFLSNVSIGYRPRGLIASDIFPVVGVSKQSDVIAQIDRGNWFRVQNTIRAPGTPGAEGGYNVSSLTYRATNYSFATRVPDEQIDNADAPHAPLLRAAEFVVDQLMLGYEDRVVTAVMSGVGSNTALSGTTAWSDFANSDPLTDIETGKEAIRSSTGYNPNLCVIGNLAWLKTKRHPDIVRAIYPGAGIGGTATTENFANLIGVDRVLVPQAIKNTATEGQANAWTDVWSSFFVLAYVAPNPGLLTPTFGYAFRWAGPNIGAGGPPGLAIERRRDDNNKCEFIRSMYYQDEKVIAPELGYLIATGIS